MSGMSGSERRTVGPLGRPHLYCDMVPQGVALGLENRAPSGRGWVARRNGTGM